MVLEINRENINSFVGQYLFRPVRKIDYKNDIKTHIAKQAILHNKHGKYFLNDEVIHVSNFDTLFLYIDKDECLKKCEEFIKIDMKDIR